MTRCPLRTVASAFGALTAAATLVAFGCAPTPDADRSILLATPDAEADMRLATALRVHPEDTAGIWIAGDWHDTGGAAELPPFLMLSPVGDFSLVFRSTEADDGNEASALGTYTVDDRGRLRLHADWPTHSLCALAVMLRTPYDEGDLLLVTDSGDVVVFTTYKPLDDDRFEDFEDRIYDLFESND